ncbi:MAG: RNA polymerase sigma factor FliA [Gammaproteobacteria bacterium]
MTKLSAYTKNRANSEDELIVEYAGLVKRIAHHLMARLPDTVQVDDLIQAGMMGLIEAARNYDPNKGASFETYAGIRIRGNMLDEVRKGNWVPRSVHRNARMIAQKMRELEHKLGRDVRDTEVAAALNIALTDYHQMLRQANSIRLFELDEAYLNDEFNQEQHPRSHPDPLESIQRQNFCAVLAQCVANLPERECLVMSLYYEEELNLKEIGEVLGVSESRVCQIHSQAMLRLRSRMMDWRD